MPIRVVLAEDSLIVREGIQRLLELDQDVEVVASCGDLDALLEVVEAQRPDVVMTDIRMPPDSSDEGIRAALALRETHPDLGVVVLSQYSDPAYALALLETGSDGRAYLLKDRVDDRSQLAGAIRAVAAGGSYIDPKVVERLVAAKGARRPTRDGPGGQQRGDRRCVGGDGAVGRKVRAHDIRQARADLGGQCQPPR